MTRCLELSDEVYEALQQAAAAAGCSPADWIARHLPTHAGGPKPPLVPRPDQPPTAPSEAPDEPSKVPGARPDQPTTAPIDRQAEQPKWPPEQPKAPPARPEPPESRRQPPEAIPEPRPIGAGLPTHELAQLRQELHDSFANRAIIYWFIYDELRQAFGPEQAEALMSRAIYRRGVQKGQELYRRFAPADLTGLKDAFVGRSADGGRLFQPEVLRADPEALDIKFHSCPLRETWRQMGLPDQEVATLCRIAAQVDYGTFEGAGFRFWADTWQPGGEGCCFLHIRPGPVNPSQNTPQ